METTFHNVTITISAKTPQEAYTKLCNLLSGKLDEEVEYSTDTFTTYDGNGDVEPEQKSTEELFPDGP